MEDVDFYNWVEIQQRNLNLTSAVTQKYMTLLHRKEGDASFLTRILSLNKGGGALRQGERDIDIYKQDCCETMVFLWDMWHQRGTLFVIVCTASLLWFCAPHFFHLLLYVSVCMCLCKLQRLPCQVTMWC
ncbi:hypothetical protein TraAM80_00561 [Trypanosoma rangeli]|uniref:Uncharacterized protein n=1 Tax=Trypanosoma rangeli TaxID=5698 RepID=A0A422P2Q2_TRYRA|nr:uncharacterized protein TraAM80_00561 [Trypanosoma rangeli]RNF12001.1 hypothetical protein TraAM80_00561 [Trypanosoma rangeli]|eukprot:RNF12001.1 hypothetical protein TraAM80_00561 [Trypanosoma rangeli]